MRTETPWGAWDPFDVSQVTGLFGACPVKWWIAGGYALEAFVGRAYREHGDIDIGFFRRDAAAMRGHLDGWDVLMADPPGTLRPWALVQPLPERAHDIWVRANPGEPFRFQLMADEGDGNQWSFRRNGAVRRPLAELTWAHDGVAYLAPEVQLLYKSRARRPKDELDFDEVAPLLAVSQRQWLAESLQAAEPGHAWLARRNIHAWDEQRPS